jgi:MoxR-like ATPase
MTNTALSGLNTVTTPMEADFSLCDRIKDNMAKVLVGKAGAMDLLLTALLAEGHILIEDVPGLGKTMIAKSLAMSIGGEFKRVQFTPDLLPADITGFNIYDQKNGRFSFQPGPVMANVLLADEINRTVPRTQAALLESMEERQVTVDGRTYLLPRPFLVVATQNPIELEGTFALPEAQLDRFILRLALGYPDQAEEEEILSRFQQADPLAALAAVCRPEDIAAMQAACRGIHVSPEVRGYIASLVRATREQDSILYGASPRGSLGLMRCAQGRAALAGRDYVLPDDVKALAEPVLGHRLILRDEERLRGCDRGELLAQILESVPPPA